MNKTDYLRKKGQLPKEDYGTAIYLKATDYGVEVYKLLIWEIEEDREATNIGEVNGEWVDEKITVNTYKFKDGYPYYVSIDKETGIGEVDTYIKEHLVTSYILFKRRRCTKIKNGNFESNS